MAPGLINKQHSMQKVTLDEEDYTTKKATSENRSVKWYDLILILLAPFSFVAYVTPNRLIIWLSSVLATGSIILLYTLHHNPDWPLSASKSHLFSALFLAQIILALIMWFRGRANEEGSLPRRVHFQDMLLAVVCPPSAIGLHRSTRWQWSVAGVLWLAVLVAVSERVQTGDWWWLKAAVGHAAAVLVAGVTVIHAHRLHMSMLHDAV